jgi:endonuclease/exonuclease/phosphatase (EEP) superfamily protein YafD
MPLELIRKLIQIGSVVTFILTLAGFFGRYLYFELTTHFRPQYVLFSVVCAISFCLLKDWKWLIPCFFCAVCNGIYVVPQYYSDNYPAKDVPAINLKLMLANVEGRSQNYDKLIESVNSAKPDIVVLQEVTEIWWEKVQPLTDIYPHYKGVPRPGGAGLAILSRFPLEQAEVLQLDSSPHPAIFSKINLDGTILSLLTIHPTTPVTKVKFTNRNRQFAESAAIMKSATNPKVLIGDLNTTMWSPYFTDLVENSGLRDVRKGRGIYSSWHSFLPNFMRIPIDHCLVGEEIEVNDVELGDYTGSDHFPLIVDLKVER